MTTYNGKAIRTQPADAGTIVESQEVVEPPPSVDAVRDERIKRLGEKVALLEGSVHRAWEEADRESRMVNKDLVLLWIGLVLVGLMSLAALIVAACGVWA